MQFSIDEFFEKCTFGVQKRPFLSKISKISKNCSSSVQHDNFILMLANDSYNVPAFYTWSPVKKKYVIYINDFLENVLFGVQNRQFLSKISNISKNSSSSVQHGNFFIMLANDSYDASAYFEYSYMKNKNVVLHRRIF